MQIETTSKVTPTAGVCGTSSATLPSLGGISQNRF